MKTGKKLTWYSLYVLTTPERASSRLETSAVSGRKSSSSTMSAAGDRLTDIPAGNSNSPSPT